MRITLAISSGSGTPQIVIAAKNKQYNAVSMYGWLMTSAS